MPKTKFQGVVFGLLMSYIMAFGMEAYNTAAWAQQMESKFKDQDFYILKTDKKPLLICICQVCLML